MNIDVLFASIAVRDLDQSKEWYGRFFGRPEDITPNDDEVMWKATDSAWVYVIRDGSSAGKSVVTLAVANLESTISELNGRGIATGPIEPVGDAGHKAIAHDPDRNSIALIEVSVR